MKTRYLAGALGCVGFLWGQGTYSMAGSGRGELPEQAPFLKLGSWRMEFRISDFGLRQAADQHIFVAGRLQVRILAGSEALSITSFFDQGSPTISIPIVGRRDIAVRVQRDIATRRVQMEIWNANGADYAVAPEQVNDGRSENYSGPVSLGEDPVGRGLFNGRVAYFRWYSTLVPERSTVPGNLAGGDLLDYELEQDMRDVSKQLVSLRAGSFAPTYARTAPAAILPGAHTIRAGYPHRLDARAAAAVTYSWHQVAGPNLLEIDDRNSPAPVITGAIFGWPSYVLRLTVTGPDGRTDENTVKIGAVPTNDDGVVKVLNEKVSFILGPMLRAGLSPWPFYDWVRANKGHELGRTYQQRTREDLNTPAAGTVTLERGSTSVTGAGTDFTALFGCRGEEEYLVVYYPLEAGGEGRKLYPVQSCTDARHVTLGRPYDLPDAREVRYQRWDAIKAKRWTEGINYYDSVLVQYQNWYRTGLDDYLAYARILADAWWTSYLIDQGRAGIAENLAPRRAGYEGLVLRALDGRPEFWPWLKTYVDYVSTIWLNRLVGNVGAFGFGTRESGYSYLFAATYAKAAPEESERQRYLTLLRERAHDLWHDYQCRSGNPLPRCQGPEGAYRWADPDFYKGFAEVPFHTALAMEGIIKAHQLTGEPVLREVLEAFLANNMRGRSGQEDIYSRKPAAFKSEIRCRAMQYWAYAEPGPGTTMNGVNEGGAECPDADAVRNNRTANNEFPHVYGYLFSLEPRQDILERGDDIFSATFARYEGPGADGLYGYYDSGTSDHGKQYGQGLRSSGRYLALRLNSPMDSADGDGIVPVDLGPLGAAKQARIRVWSPAGGNRHVACPRNPCLVTIDARLGGHPAKIEYLDGLGRVMNTRTRLLTFAAPVLARRPIHPGGVPGRDSVLWTLRRDGWWVGLLAPVRFPSAGMVGWGMAGFGMGGLLWAGWQRWRGRLASR